MSLGLNPEGLIAFCNCCEKEDKLDSSKVGPELDEDKPDNSAALEDAAEHRRIPRLLLELDE